MSDIAIAWNDLGGDIALDGPDLATDSGLRTAVVLSLFLDGRARRGDQLPDGSGDRRGWWADALAEDDPIGSRLWLLSREKQTAEVAERAREYTEEALAWLIRDGVARAVRAEAEWVERGLLGLRVEIERPTGDVFEHRFGKLWESV